jgi:hypothetical protein
MRRYLNMNSVSGGWSLSEDREVSLNGQAFSVGDGTAEFCISPLAAIVIQISESSPLCQEAVLEALPSGLLSMTFTLDF